MWQAPNQRVRAVANAKKREREKSRRPIHIKRINAQLEVKQANSQETFKTHVRLILNDLSTKGVGLFSPEPLVPGQDIVLSIADPHQINLKARVIWCQEHTANSHVISAQPFSYRMGLEFELSTVEEQQSIKVFCEEVSKNHLYSVKAV
jgi:hypothetical protein